MSVLYRPSRKWIRLQVGIAAVCGALMVAALIWRPMLMPLAFAGMLYCSRRAMLYEQEFELTHAGLICRSRFGEQRLLYRQIAAMRFSPFTGDLLLERPWVLIRIPKRHEHAEEIRRVVSLAVWAHRGGDVPPDLAESHSAFAK
ncbi:MAG: hypothetical protein K2X03_10150 [Bryobacteraceae bacterium]|nr:hypothetical protein [Bryobacteraceae bacterium]